MSPLYEFIKERVEHYKKIKIMIINPIPEPVAALFDKELIVNGDGKEKLDFTYIEDLTDGILNIINNKNSINQIFNLTYGEGREINEMIDILKWSFPKIKVKKVDRDNLMPYRGTLSMNKAKSLLNLKPQWKLEKAYKKYIEWYIKFYSENFKN